ncbi:Multidrug resistance protein MexA precursor [Agrobacterium sp. DSM 25558]|uniref:efflux RND transporter periplasmic adaptor subunit n=1 Tax=Agrobacterium sp. DSM 25558 TaxID=1907665 RepID=UPI0009724CA3|nr:efflux RND transporter periplasmic adaptor subunit [Agrobacterium sp. DSM 25558]SCX09047.1 Multidrug resistance protein MexA precursor [Agrobacterium sp. DSM 25558]
MKRRLYPLFTTLLVAGILAGCSESDEAKKAPAQGNQRPPAPVSVVTMKKSDYPLTTLLPGRADAFQTADIRPRVGGIIKDIAFKEGSFVKSGDLLYKIDDDTYQASLAEAQASLERAEVSVPAAEANLQRYERLANSGASQKEFEDARTTLLQAKASVAEARATLQTAQINLSLTEVRAPFDGVTSATNFSIGNVVTASQTGSLMTLRKINPIYIQLNESSVNLLRLQSAIKAGKLERRDNSETTDIRLTLEDGSEYPNVGKLDMSEMAVSTTTGTVSIRTLFDNPENTILPGMYVRATITVGKEIGYLIPQRAGSRNANGELTAKFVTAENKVETRTFPTSQLSGNNWLVTENVADGDRLIADGFQWIADNATVKPIPAEIDEKGSIIEKQDAQAAPAPAPKS